MPSLNPTIPVPAWARTLLYLLGWGVVPAVALVAVVYAYERSPASVRLNLDAPDRYTGTQAAGDWGRQHLRDDAQDVRISTLESSALRRLDVLEERIKNLSESQAAGFARIEKRLESLK